MTINTRVPSPSTLAPTLRTSRPFASALALTLLPLLFAAGCKKTVDDPTLTKNIQAALTGDPSISQQPVQVGVQSGVATLSGNVSDDTARSVAAQDAARVPGVKEVVNNLTVAGMPVAPTITSPSNPAYARPASVQEQQKIANHQPLTPPSASAPAPPPPVVRTVTLPAGTDIPIRITETLDSQTTQSGTTFTGVVVREIDADGFMALPVGATVHGVVDEAKDATHFKGSSLLVIELNAVRRHGTVIPLSTDTYTVAGKGRGVNSIEKIGGGAAIGAVLGGIFGGGKGAAIGAAAGGGGGAAVQGFTRGQQVRIPSESIIRFRLSNPLTISTSEPASTGSYNQQNGPYNNQQPGLQPRQ